MTFRKRERDPWPPFVAPSISAEAGVRQRDIDEISGSPVGLFVDVLSEDAEGPDLFTNIGSDHGSVELETLEDLLAFAREWGKLIIYSEEDHSDGQPEISIYDDYAE